MAVAVGLGLGDERDISVKGLEAVRSCQKIYLDHYTSILGVNKINLESLYEKEVILADREMVESSADVMLENAINENVAFLVVGDPFGATTHTDLYLRAIRRNIPVKVIHNASILNAIGSCGLQLYSFGPTVTIPFFTDRWRPTSPYIRLSEYWLSGYHTLCLLDIKVKEQSEENLLKGKLVYEPPRFMTVKQAVSQLMECEEREGKGVCSGDRLGVGMMRIGGEDQRIVVGTLDELVNADEEVYGSPLHSFILPAKHVHELEFEMLRLNALPNSIFSKMSFKEYEELYIKQ